MTLAKYPVSGGGSGDISGPGVAVTDNGIVLWDGTGGTTIKDGGVGSANQILKTDGTTPSFGLLVNDNVDNSAAIAYSKLALTGSVVNADINASAAIAYSKLALTGSLVNADVNASAAIAYSKLDLTGSIVNADVNASAAIDFSKLATLASGNILVGSAGGVATSVAMSGDITISNAGVTAIGTGVIVNADVNASAAIAYSKLSLGNSIVNSDISSGANIALSKLNSLTSNRAVETNGAGHLSASTVTTTELGYVSGVTSSIQTQLNSKLSAAITSLGGQTGATQTFSSTDSSITITSGSDDHDIELADTIPGARTFSGAVTLSGGVSGNVAFDTNTLFVDSVNNRVAIGTTTATNPLTVKSSLGTPTGLTGTEFFDKSILRLNYQSGTSSLFVADSGSNNVMIQIASASGTTAEDLHLQPFGGNVGIGTSSPSDLLHISSTGGTPRLRIESTQGSGSLGAIIFDTTANANSFGMFYRESTTTFHMVPTPSSITDGPTVASEAALSITDAGAVTLGQIHNIGAGNITSGTYTPTLTGVTNITSVGTAVNSRYSRVGNIVTVTVALSGQTATSGSSAVTRFRISLPISSNFTAVTQAQGCGTMWRGTATLGASPAVILSNATTDDVDVYYLSFVTTSVEGYLTFQYEVL